MSAWFFATETEAQARKQDLIRAGAGDGLVLVERLAVVGDQGGPQHYEVTVAAREPC